MIFHGWAAFVAAILIPPAVAYPWWLIWPRHIGWHYPATWLSVCAGAMMGAVGAQGWPSLAGTLISAAGALLAWWWRRRKRRRADSLIGAKSRALRAKLVQKVRESAKPRQVLRPVPGGAG